MSEPIDHLVDAGAFVDRMTPRADGLTPNYHYPLWRGWALREAYLAGAEAERRRCLDVLARFRKRTEGWAWNDYDAILTGLLAETGQPTPPGTPPGVTAPPSGVADTTAHLAPRPTSESDR